MATKNQVLAGEDVLFIKRTNLVREYQTETVGFKGKKYRIFAFGDRAFAVHEDDNFEKDLEEGNVAQVMITVNDEGQWSLANYITWSKKVNQRKHAVEFESITVDNFKPSTVARFEELS